jgi:enhancing lycopene biosynthesis protein 2
MAAKVAVVLSGCGFMDGAEIQESVFTLYFLDRAGIEVACFAPNAPQLHVVNHLTGKPTNEQRNVLVESARIARGAVQDLAQAKLEGFDGLVLPGGFGMAKNLSDFAAAGPEAEVNADLVRLVGEAVTGKKPIVAICISPAVLAAALAKLGSSAKLTIGNDAGTAEAIEKLGSSHASCPVDQAVTDEEHRIVSCPAYMLGPNPAGVAAGIEAAIKQLAAWLK